MIGSAPYFGSTFIAEPPKNHALSKCIGILAPCLSGVSLVYLYFTQCSPPFRTISWADRTTTITQHPQPQRNTNGKQLLGPRGNKGFPYLKYQTEPVFHISNITQNHIGVSSYIQNHTKSLCRQTLFNSQSHTKNVFMYPINQFICRSYVRENMVSLGDHKTEWYTF